MKRSRLFLLLGVMALFSLGYFFQARHEAPKPKVFITYTHETTMTWSNAPDVELDAGSLKKLNDEIEVRLRREAPRENFHYPVFSLDKKWVEVMFLSDKEMPELLRKNLEDHIRRRLPDLAREQAAAVQVK